MEPHVPMILTWNPQRWDFEPGEYDRYVEQTQRTPTVAVEGSWSAGRRRHGVRVGDRAYLLRQGSDRRGIVASGAVASEPYPRRTGTAASRRRGSSTWPGTGSSTSTTGSRSRS
jgi:hypothetical protein